MLVVREQGSGQKYSAGEHCTDTKGRLLCNLGGKRAGNYCKKGGKLLCLEVTLCCHQVASFVFQLKEHIKGLEVLPHLSLTSPMTCNLN